ncbi:MAG: class I SAM-dependent RNA methyltransferase [Deltaproteobacteria bacterium]|nr:class I SAM-dependent RNA methyltransferase [Deltaproteobacteria bacterium]
MIDCPFEADVADLGGLGDGIVRHPDGPVVLAAGVVPGDRLRIEQLTKQRGVLRAGAFQVVAESPQRCAPACAVFDECGGCGLQRWDLERQREWKRAQLARALGLPTAAIALAAVEPRGHRRRTRLHLRMRQDGLGAGFLRSQSDVLVADAACAVLAPELEHLRARAGAVLGPYLDRGELRAVLGRQGVIADLTGRPTGAAVPPAAELAGALGVVGLQLQIGRHADRWGLGEVDLPEVDGPLTVATDAAGFCQASAHGNRALREQVARALDGLAPPSYVQEFYAGSGNFTGMFLQRGASVRAVEADVDAVRRLRRSVAAAGLSDRVEVVCAQAERAALPTQPSEIWLLDPGRQGAPEVCAAAARLQPAGLIYVSCALDKLVRDLGPLRKAGWVVQQAALIDAFVWTVHLESVVTLLPPAGSAGL